VVPVFLEVVGRGLLEELIEVLDQARLVVVHVAAGGDPTTCFGNFVAKGAERPETPKAPQKQVVG
jgi:hypothetical protein